MKIGDKVKFLSDIGGGTVVGFKGNNIALVEDEDGFEIPTPTNELVVVDDEKQSKYGSSVNGQTESKGDDVVKAHNEKRNADLLEKINDNVRINVVEREDGDELNLYLGIVPLDKKSISKSAFHFYVINDSNYFVSYSYSLFNGKQWILKSHNDLEPNTKLLIAESNIESVADYKNGAFQLYAYKAGKTFSLLPTLDVRLKIDPVKFYKLHSFRENEFFDDDAMVMPLVEKGAAVRQLEIGADELEKGIMEKRRVDVTSPARKTKTGNQNPGEPLVIDLHASELLDSTAGLSSVDILNYQLDTFRKTLVELKNKKGAKVIFIHGKGEGVLRNAIVNELRYKYKHYTYQDASFREYGYGATQVTIH